MGAAAVPIATALISVGATAYNTRRTERKQDQAAAAMIRNRSKEQGKIDERVNQQLADVEASRSDDERRASANSYATALRNTQANREAGLTPQIGSAAFQSLAAQRAAETGAYADQQAGLLSRLDAPIDQRRGEAVSATRFGEDLDIARRFSQGNSYLDQLRYNRIRRNPWIDAAAQLAGGLSGGMMASAGQSGAATGGMLNANAMANAGGAVGSAGGLYNGYYIPPRW